MWDRRKCGGGKRGGGEVELSMLYILPVAPPDCTLMGSSSRTIRFNPHALDQSGNKDWFFYVALIKIKIKTI